MPVRAEVAVPNELSGYPDQRELIRWMKPIAPELERVFLVHCEPAGQQALTVAIREEYGVEVAKPARGEVVELA
ncbi:MAG TPA: MBL fold metallo-hydrolase RNA specificity domain-containing protein [Bryobacteraceae bacterium]|nr:MBL fold metallo-hydrolase RNA specificity domain-containing protein [Bryobacteraceae bacterium]